MPVDDADCHGHAKTKTLEFARYIGHPGEAHPRALLHPSSAAPLSMPISASQLLHSSGARANV
jgi:hypothetical protein